jgi:hypothetical protein
VFDRDAQRFDVGGDVSQFLRVGQGRGKRVHRRVVAQTGTDIGHLLDQHGGVLAGQLREGAVGTTGAGRQVAGAADLVTFLATHLVALELQASIFSPPGRSICRSLPRCRAPWVLAAGGAATAPAIIASETARIIVSSFPNSLVFENPQLSI